jgi:hypothetical protein
MCRFKPFPEEFMRRQEMFVTGKFTDYHCMWMRLIGK